MPSELAQAALAIAQGGVIAHATEGVWGFACNPHDDRAVQRILEIKQRPAAKGLLVIGAANEFFAAELEGHPRRTQIEQSWPGPHTWILPNTHFSTWVTGEHGTIACRVPGHAQARALSATAKMPLVSTSANRAAEAPALTEADVRAQFSAELDYILPGEVINPGEASTIYDLKGEVMRG